MKLVERLKRVVVDTLPEPLAERLLPWNRRAFRAAGLTRAGSAPRRLFIGPVNSAGQGYAWARAAERLPGVAASDFMYRSSDDAFGFPADHSVPTAYFVSNRRWQSAQRRAIVQRFTHVLIESGRTLLGSASTAVDIELFRRYGLEVALVWHGSDIRIPSVHAQEEADSPFRDGAYSEQARLEEIARQNHQLIGTSCARSFVSTPDLLTYVPEATWLPVVVNPERWRIAAAAQPLTRPRPVVVHVPSRAGLKGTALVTGTLRALDAEGLIVYRELADIPASDMPTIYGDADIVLDQFSLGIYGVAACEAMASGRVVISHVSDDVRDRVLRLTGRTLPILETRASDIESTIRRIIAHPELGRALAQAGPDFVRDIHDGRRSSEALRGYLGISERDMGDWNNAY